jgi:hypothetical protein
MYSPDFIVRTATDVYVVETKAQSALSDENVQRKQRSALAWVEQINRLDAEDRSDRNWHYVLLGEQTARQWKALNSRASEALEFSRLRHVEALGQATIDFPSSDIQQAELASVGSDTEGGLSGTSPHDDGKVAGHGRQVESDEMARLATILREVESELAAARGVTPPGLSSQVEDFLTRTRGRQATTSELEAFLSETQSERPEPPQDK